MTGDMIKILKSCFFKKQFFTFNFSKKCKNWHFLKKQFFSFLIISPVIFDLQKRTIPQIKALNILFWPYFIHFIARMDIWWAMKPRKCPVFFSPDFIITIVIAYTNKRIKMLSRAHFIFSFLNKKSNVSHIISKNRHEASTKASLKSQWHSKSQDRGK